MNRKYNKAAAENKAGQTARGAVAVRLTELKKEMNKLIAGKMPVVGASSHNVTGIRFSAGQEGRREGWTMKEQIHTPGLWHINMLEADTGLHSVHSSAGCIAECHRGVGDCISVDEREANARLIAAAPELLSALRGLLEYADAIRVRGHGDNLECKAARAAIAKATGGKEAA